MKLHCNFDIANNKYFEIFQLPVLAEHGTFVIVSCGHKYILRCNFLRCIFWCIFWIQVLILYRVCVFQAVVKTKITALTSDWLNVFDFLSAKIKQNLTNLIESKFSACSTKSVFFGQKGL